MTIRTPLLLAYFTRIRSSLSVGDGISFHHWLSLVHGMAELLMPNCVWVFSLASHSVPGGSCSAHLVMAQCHQCPGAAASALPKVGKLGFLGLLSAFVCDLSTSHSCLLHGMVRAAKALLLKPVFHWFLSLCLHLPQHIYTSTFCA